MEIVNAIGLDDSGNIFLGGTFSGTANFGGPDRLSAGQQDCFIAKYSFQGEYRWDQVFGGTQVEQVNALATDSQGNVIATGYFQGTMTVGPATLNSDLASIDAFLVKFASDGTFVWVNPWAMWFGSPPTVGYDMDGASADYGTDVAVDKRINPASGLPYDTILALGYFMSPVNLGGGLLLPTGGGGYIAKLRPDGTHVWSKAWGTSNPARFWAMALDRNGDLAVSGDFHGQTFLGGGTILGTSVATDGFIAKYSGVDGSHLWSFPIQGTYVVNPKRLVADSVGNFILTGYFQGDYHFGSQVLTTGISGASDGFLAKYSSAGATVWAEGLGGHGSDGALAVSVGGSGHPVLTGSFSETATFGSWSQTTTVNPAGFLYRHNP